MNGESLLGTRHKHAVNIISSLHDNARLLVCDGYNDSKVVQGHELHGYSGPNVPQVVPAKVDQGHKPKANHGHDLQFQGREGAAGKVGEGHGLVAQGHEVVLGQARVPVVRGHEMPPDNVSQGQGLMFQGRDKVSGLIEVNAGERWRERARQRRLARYSSTYCCFDQLIWFKNDYVSK